MDYVPDVTPEHVLRIIRRDFPQEDALRVLSELNQYGHEPWQPEPDRVRLAILKLSRGDLDLLRRFVAVAQRDFRDVLAPAECPRAFTAAFSWDTHADAARLAELAQADWQQYQIWLASAEYCGGPQDALVARGEAAFFRGPAKSRRSLPGWAAPIIGPLVCVPVVLLGFFSRATSESLLLGLGVVAIIGFIAGLVVWAVDRRSP